MPKSSCAIFSTICESKFVGAQKMTLSWKQRHNALATADSRLVARLWVGGLSSYEGNHLYPNANGIIRLQYLHKVTMCWTGGRARRRHAQLAPPKTSTTKAIWYKQCVPLKDRTAACHSMYKDVACARGSILKVLRPREKTITIIRQSISHKATVRAREAGI